MVFRPIRSKIHFLPDRRRQCFFLGFLHTSRQMCFKHKSGRRPLRITDRTVSTTVHQGKVGVPNELTTFRFHDAALDFVEPSVWSTQNHAASNPRSARPFFKKMLAKIVARINFSPGKLENSYKPYLKIGPIDDRQGKLWLGSPFFLVFNYWPSISNGITPARLPYPTSRVTLFTKNGFELSVTPFGRKYTWDYSWYDMYDTWYLGSMRRRDGYQ